MNWLLRAYSAVGSARRLKDAAGRAAEGVRRAKRLAANIPANHFSISFERAKDGDVAEQYEVGERYYEGRGIPQSVEDAAIWFSRAARGGHARAQSALAMMLHLGRGLPRNPVEAAKWILIARAADEPVALETADNLLRRLNSGQLAQARREARDFQPRVWKGSESK